MAVVAFHEQGHPRHTKIARAAGFTRKAIGEWAMVTLGAGSTVISNGLSYFAAVTDAGCIHHSTAVGGPKPQELPIFHWVKTVLSNVKTGLSGACHAFDYGEYAQRYLGAIAYRFNRLFDLHRLPNRLLVAAVASGPCTER